MCKSNQKLLGSNVRLAWQAGDVKRQEIINRVSQARNNPCAKATLMKRLVMGYGTVAGQKSFSKELGT